MDQQMEQVLELFTQPAFLVSDGVVTWRNHAAYAILNEGTPIHVFLEGHGSLYSLWDRQGTLQIPLVLEGETYDASVRVTEKGDLFVASQHSAELYAGASAMINASVSLRKPLQSMVTAADVIYSEADESDARSAAANALNRSIYQMVRLCGQMSDGGRLLLHRHEVHKESIDLQMFFERFIKEVRPLVEEAGWLLEYVPSERRIRADADPALLERALYNLLSNALNYTPKGGKVTIRVRRQDRLAFVCVSDSGEGIAPEQMSTVFGRFADRPIGDSRWGVGMGLQMVREIARLHGGTMMFVGSGEHGGASVTFSLSLDPAPLTLKSRRMHYDYCGEFHHGLVELSDVLNAEQFDPREV